MRAAHILTLAVLFYSVCSAQQWTMGAAAGGGFSHDASVVNATGSASAGIAPQVAAGIVIGDDAYNYIGGEFRYTYRGGDLRLQANGQSATMSANTHTVHYDFLFYATHRESRIRPFAAAGGGGRFYRTTGREQAFQPLSSFAFLTKTHQAEPMLSFGGGVKAMLTRHAQFRVDFRDFVTPFPNRVIAPAPGAKSHGWLHDFVPLAGLSYVF